ncbi:hypothetical protein HZS_1911 [Henneguya salminicola]|nr:hypothetical protein HZS_1911 [Henneguya salminicola]
MCIYPIYTNGQHSLSNNFHFKPCFDNSSSQKRLCKENKCIVQGILKDICQNISKLDNFVNGLELELKS